jgi:hypothetical protein
MKNNFLSVFFFILIFTGLSALLWVTSGCDLDSNTDNPQQTEEGFIGVNINLDIFAADAPLPFAWSAAGSCTSSGLHAFNSANALCRPVTGSTWSFKSALPVTATTAVLTIEAQGTNNSQYRRQQIVAEADLQKDAFGNCFAKVMVPTNESSLLSIQLIDKCCPFNSRTIQWISRIGDVNLSIQPGTAKTQAQLTAGSNIVVRNIKLIPFATQPCQ